jgi:hypothetical protein
MRNQDQKIIYVRENAAAVSKDANSDLRMIKDFIDLYFDGGAVTRSGLTNILERHREKLGRFLSGAKLSIADLVDLLFKFDANNDGKLTVGEVADGIARSVPILKWVPAGQGLTADELEAALESAYPGAAKASVRGLRDVLMRFDEPWAGGDGNGRVTRQELATAGIVAGVLSQTETGQPFKLPDNAPQADRLAIAQLERKLDAQVFGRHNASGFADLEPATAQLEWMQLGLKLYLSDQLTHHFGGEEGKLGPSAQVEALTAYGPEQQPHWAFFRAFCDSALAGGDGDGKLNSLETFNCLTELQYAQKLWAAVDGDFSASGVDRSRVKKWMLANLMTVFPLTGQEMFMGNAKEWAKDPWSLNRDFWDGLRLYDDALYGGNGDGRLDAAEVAMAMGVVRVVENVYALYDTNHDGVLTKREAAPLFASLGFHDGRLIDAFFADIGLDGGSAVWNALKMFFSGRSGIDRLTPFEFYKRLVKVLPRVIKK